MLGLVFDSSYRVWARVSVSTDRAWVRVRFSTDRAWVSVRFSTGRPQSFLISFINFNLF